MRSHRHARRAFTLIEILLALSILVLVVGLAYTVYFSVQSTLGRQAGWRNGEAQAYEFLDVLRRDLACALAPEGLDGPLFSLSTPDQGASNAVEWTWYTAVVSADETDLKRFQTERVAYRLEQSATPDTPSTLVREALVLGVDPPQPPDVSQLPCVKDLHVTLFDGTDWVPAWGGMSSNPLPRAARIQLSVTSGRRNAELATDVMIPAGNIVAP